jgi:hypothetical protein
VFVGCEMGTGNTTPLLVVLVIGKPGSNIGIVTVPLTMLDIGVVGQDFGFLLDAVVKVNWVILALKTEVEGEWMGVGIQTVPLRTLVTGILVGQIGIQIPPLKVLDNVAVGQTDGSLTRVITGAEVGWIGVGIHTVPLRMLVIGKVVGPVAQIGIALVPLILVLIGVVGGMNIELAWELSEPVTAEDLPEAVSPLLETTDEPSDATGWLDGEILTAKLEEPPGRFEELGVTLLPPVWDNELWTGEDTFPADVDELVGALVEPGALVERENKPGKFVEPIVEETGTFVEPAIDEPGAVIEPGASDNSGACVEPLADEIGKPVGPAADESGAFVEPLVDELTGVNPLPTDVACTIEDPAEPVLETSIEAKEVEIPMDGSEVVPRPGVEPSSAA